MKALRQSSIQDRIYKANHNRSGEAAGKRLVRVYDLAIEAARNGNPEGVRYCLELLRNTLDPSSNPEVALTQSQLYQDCEAILMKRDFPQLMEVLEHIRGLWAARMKMDAILQECHKPDERLEKSS